MREIVYNQMVSIEHINTNLMIVDPSTKALKQKTFKEHSCNMGLHSLLKNFFIEILWDLFIVHNDSTLSCFYYMHILME